MKNLLIATGAFTLLLNATLTGEEKTADTAGGMICCAEMQDSMLVMMKDSEPLMQDLVFENGIKVRVDGSVVYPDGLTTTLQAGQCVDNTGALLQ